MHLSPSFLPQTRYLPDLIRCFNKMSSSSPERLRRETPCQCCQDAHATSVVSLIRSAVDLVASAAKASTMNMALVLDFVEEALDKDHRKLPSQTAVCARAAPGSCSVPAAEATGPFAKVMSA
ncbi:hypothetical protein RRG08_027033 [Elysia crispata]|uniref:Uncharacterized protein n=1 Tax=Elysia crispata TaxID=231223 RepID=A0AAE0ZHB4_9GAST|nr:hypothetical protein RRG08_027033 [Elysia crispata]